MESWSSFFLSLLWLSILSVVFNNNNFINIIIFSETVWVIIYTLSCVLGIINDDIVIMSLTFLCLGLAGLEFSIGILLITLYKSNTGSIFILKKKS